MGFVATLLKAFFVIPLLTVIRSVVARLKIEQTFTVFYRWFRGAGMVQVGVVLLVAAMIGNPF